jgi:hypothetical protein
MSKNYIEAVREDLAKRIDVEENLLDLYTLLVFTRGVHVTWEDVHDAWAVWRNITEPRHHSLVPFDELTKKVQEMDQEYADAIRETAKEINPRNINF